MNNMALRRKYGREYTICMTYISLLWYLYNVGNITFFIKVNMSVFLT